jgi:hypothetical protein
MDQPQQHTHDESVKSEQTRRDANHSQRTDHGQDERRVRDIGAPDGVDRRGLTEREKRERWPIG